MTSPPITMPRQLGRYEILERLAYGGMAEIFLASERGPAGLQRLVVVKRILPHLAAHEHFVNMFLQEARFVCQLNHPNVVQIHELGEQGSEFFIVMEYIEGSSLRDLTSQAARLAEPLPLGAAVGIIAQACAGAHAAHELCDAQGNPVGLVHRDISPHNLMVTAQGHVKLLDFGIAKATELGLDQTMTGGLKGKLHYMSPEQCRHEPLDRRSDIFALGIVLWELITGRRLFKRETELHTMQAIVEGDVPDASVGRPGLHPALGRITAKALALDRGLRFSTAEAMRQQLLEAAEQAGLATTSDTVAVAVQHFCGEAQARTRAQVREIVGRSTAITRSVPPPAFLAARRNLADDATEVDGEVDGEVGNGQVAGEERSRSRSTTARVARQPVTPSDAPQQRFRLVVTRALAVLLAATVAAGVVWWTLQARAPVLTGPEVTFGFAPSFDPTIIVAEMEPLRRFLERRLGRPFRIVVPANYRALGEQLLKGELQFALLPPNLYIETHQKEPRIVVELEARYEGATGSDGVLLVPEGSEVQDVGMLRGKRFCFTDPDSTSGYLLPRAALVKVGIDPERDLKEIRLSGNHLQLMKDLNAGLCDAGGTYSLAYLAAERAGVNVSRMRVLAITGRAPQEAFVANPDVPAPLRAALTQTLLNLKPREVGSAEFIGKVMRISGFVAGADAHFDGLREALKLAKRGLPAEDGGVR